jgi:alpha-L-fucosidase
VPYRPAGEIVHELVDIVSKNGNMLLNVPPRSDGTLDAETEQILASIGRWLAINGEAIYETRPWVTCGQGNVRFTRRPDAVYVILLNWPETGNVLEVPELGQHRGIGPISGVTLLGYTGELCWGQDGGEHAALRVVLPESRPCDHAWTLRVAFETAP